MDHCRLGCDGDSVSITAATQPSIEDIVMGQIPGLPKVHLHNPVLAYENGDEFMKYWYEAEQGRLDPFMLVIEGSIPNEKNQCGGLLGGARHRPEDRPANHHQRVDRSACPKAWAVVCRPAPARLWRHPRHGGQSDRRMGLADYLGWDWKSKAGIPIVNVPGCPVQPDNFMETLLYLLFQVGGVGAHDSAGRATPAHLAVRRDRPRRV